MIYGSKMFKKNLAPSFYNRSDTGHAQKGKKSELQQWKDFIENARL